MTNDWQSAVESISRKYFFNFYLVPMEEMQQVVEDQLKIWLRVPPKARAITKTLLRQEVANRLIKKKEADTEVFVSLVGSAPVQKDLGRYIQMMKARSKK